MKIYLLSLAAGLLVGVIYDLLGVRSPAPPVVALVGLFGMVVGEQALPTVKRIIAETIVTTLAASDNEVESKDPNHEEEIP